MNLGKLVVILKSTGLKVAYSHFNDYTELPFITYIDGGSNNLFADNSTFQKAINVDVELYFEYKDLELEEKLEKALNDNNIPWESYPDVWIESEKCFQKIYEIGVIINGK